jgi:hypothetical protein
MREFPERTLNPAASEHRGPLLIGLEITSAW